MSFVQNIIDSICPRENITITTRPYNINESISGYSKTNNYTLQYKFPKGTSISTIKQNINKYKSPNFQIKQCYIKGFKVKDSLIISEDEVVYLTTKE